MQSEWIVGILSTVIIAMASSWAVNIDRRVSRNTQSLQKLSENIATLVQMVKDLQTSVIRIEKSVTK